MRFRRSPAPRRGIALFLTLVVLSLIAVFLTEFSFETTLEVRALQNSQSSFQARNAVKSLFKAVLVGLQGGEAGNMAEADFFEQIAPLLQFAQGVQQGTGFALPTEDPGLGLAADEAPPVSFLNPPDLTVIPEELVQYALPEFYASFADVTFYTPSIRPIDHLYNLNRVQSPKRTLEPERTKPDAQLANQFLNLLNTDEYQDEENGYLFSEPTALGIYGRVFDWVDQGDSPFQSNYPGVVGNELGYRGQTLSYPVKNGFLESVDEVSLLLPLDEPRLPPTFWKKYFTVYPVGDAWDPQQDAREVKARINVNLATQEELERFLSQFNQDGNGYLSSMPGEFYDDAAANFYQKRAELAEALKASQNPLTSKDIDAKVGTLVSTGRADDFFIAASYWYEIRLRAAVGGVTAEVRAVVSVKRTAEGLVEENSTRIHEFQLR